MGCMLASACMCLGQVPGTGEQLRVAGPLLNFLGCDPASGSWRGSVLLVTPPSSDKAVMAAQPTLTVLDEGAPALQDCGPVLRQLRQAGRGSVCTCLSMHTRI